MTDSNNNVIANVPGDLDTGQQQIVVNAIRNAIASGGTFQLQPDGSPGSAAMAQSIMQQAGVSGGGVQVLPASNSNGFLNGVKTAVDALASGNLGVRAGVTAAKAAATPNYLETHAANWGLIALGVVLGVGALLISQKETIVQIGTTVAKVAAE